MRTRVLTALCIAAAWLGLTAMPAMAVVPNGQSRVMTFTLGACNGAGKVLTLNATGFTPNSTHYIEGGAVNLSVATGTVKFLILASPQNPGRTILIMSTGETGARYALPALYAAMADASGKVPIVVQGACNGPGTIAGFVTIYFQ